MENRKRSVQIIVRVTEEERALIEEKMKQIPTMNLSAYSRKMLIDGYIIVLDLQEVKAHTAQLQKIGVNINQIAKLLTADKVLTVKAHYAKQNGKALPDKPYKWSAKSIAGILERPEYTGCTVNFKTYFKSHKLKKRLNNAPENYRIFPNTQPTIIDEKVFERVQELRKNKRRPAKQAERQGLFSGLLYCADCGSKLHFATGKNMTPEQDCYRCARYKSNTGDCTMHYIREETLKLFVLHRIFDVTAMFIDNADDFRMVVQKQRFEETEKAVKRRKRELEQAKKRIAELDRIFKRIYEDDITGAISHERFLKLSAEYETEQKELTKFVKTEQAAVDTYEQDRADFDSFAAIIRKYVGIKELTPTIVNEFVKKIIVHAPTSPADIADRKSKSFGTSSGSWIKTRTHKPPDGKEKAERHSLSTMLPCKYDFTSLWLCQPECDTALFLL